MEFGICKKSMFSFNACEGHMQTAYLLENVCIRACKYLCKEMVLQAESVAKENMNYKINQLC